MGPEGISMNVDRFEFQDPATGEWHDITEIKELTLVPTLPPGYLLGQPIAQVSPGVYEVPDSLLVRTGWGDIAGLGFALQAAMAKSAPGTTITTTRDLARKMTVITVIDPEVPSGDA